VRPSPKNLPNWLLLPPAAALLLLLGPLAMQPPAVPVDTAPAGGQDAASATLGSHLWPAAGAVLGVLVLGAGVLVALRRPRGGGAPAPGAAAPIVLRQTLRLSARQAVHAIEFGGRVLLVGEHERGLVLLGAGGATEPSLDEGRARTGPLRAAGAEDDDQGAVPKDLVIPRPPVAAARIAAGVRRRNGLADFRALLQKAGR
jgi:hypothetical protein